MKLMPASRALATIRIDVASSVGPPNIMVPRQIGEIFRPLRPSWRYSIGGDLSAFGCHSGWRVSSRPGMTEILRLRSSQSREALRIVLQDLEHPAGGGHAAVTGGQLGRHEDQAAGGADHARLRYQNLADFGTVDK